MSNQHRNRPLNVRPPNEDRDAAEAALAKMGFTLTQFVTAALRRFARDPHGMYSLLEADWPGQGPVGRPRRKDES